MSNTGKLVIVMFGMGLLATCHQSILTAPPGSGFEAIFANPTFIPANGGVSVITAVVYDLTGQPVPDGTVVQFFTDLGRIDEQGRTNDGVARVNLVADGRSGTAEVCAVIGGGAAPTPPTTVAAAGNATTASTSSAARTAATGAADCSVKVEIGSINPKRILLAADPRNIASDGPRFSTITATVIGESGNPIANIPVVFSFLVGDLTVDPYEETLESRGLPVYTDNNGQARDRVFTDRARDAVAKEISVQAEPVVTATAIKVKVEIGVNY